MSLISVRSVVQINPGPLGKYKPRMALRPAEFCCDRRSLRSVAEAVTRAAAGACLVGGRPGSRLRQEAHPVIHESLPDA